MVQGISGRASYHVGLDVARKVMREYQVALQRIQSICMTYSPSSAVWWVSYTSSQRVIWSCSIVITTPLDSIKTQLHIQSWIFTKYFRSHLWATFWHLCVIKALIAEDRWKGFYTGIGPSFFSTSAWGTSMILASEYVSM
uniref:Putative carrier protein n=1 Tax=Helianthus annuus TaxID=4232 RepID=A0A251SAV4_HELAN